MEWSAEQILALAPDDTSAKAAKGLLVPAKWPLLAHSDAAVWGECQGSGSKPYQVQIDLAGPAFKCSCPSRKFPCKHGLALFLLRVQKAGSFKSAEPPAWVGEWLASRQQRAEKQTEKKAAAAEQAAAPPDPEAAAKREAKRRERMTAGVAELERWMHDQVRHGLGQLNGKPASFWQELAARMVDAQLPGLAAWVRQMESAANSGPGWPERLLAVMGRVQLLAAAFNRLEALPPATQADIRTALGWAMDKEEVLAGGAKVSDAWFVLGQSFEENGKLWERRVWLHGARTKRAALLLDFSHGSRKFDHAFASGAAVEMTLAFYPGAVPLRAIVGSEPAAAAGVSAPAKADFEPAFDGIAAAVAGNPWLNRLPFAVNGGVPGLREGIFSLADDAGGMVPMRASENEAWELIALSGGQPVSVFGEWNGEHLRPLTCWANAEIWTGATG